ncbi:hypothetical protein WDV76_08820 [Xenorhabdus griffiniae]|uniref:hypothetical protein n=1 Tax=Xenorhabdus griffiniae TaxID=351672 RepID=UPI0030D51204
MADFTVRIELHDATSSDYSSDTRNCGSVRDLAYDVAKSVKKNPSVLVTEVKRRSWIGLKSI